MNAKVEITRTNLGCRVVRTEDETGEHLVLSVPVKRTLRSDPLVARDEELPHELDAAEFFAAEQCPADSNFR